MISLPILLSLGFSFFAGLVFETDDTSVYAPGWVKGEEAENFPQCFGLPEEERRHCILQEMGKEEGD